MSPMIAPEILEEVRSRNDIVAVVESFMPLQRQGTTLKALCPFHKEKTPSFVVNPQRQIFHCFGCGKGGDVFRFVMEYEKLDFIAAVQLLARRAGVRLEQSAGTASGQPSPRETFFEINQGAARFYHQYLLEDDNAADARRYLAERALPEQAIQDFMLGYAPDKWDAFLNWARRKYTPALLEQSGLIVQPAERGRAAAPRWYDRFRKRLMFPIRDEQGRVIGFSGRVLAGDDQGAKYVNTPETLIFHKGRVLYGLDRARRAIADAGLVMVCEGQIDVIQCHLAGFGNTVAAQGTAFTEEHARILRRYADNVLLVFDADRAGQNASLRTGEVFLQAGLAVRIAILPQGDDPDTILRRPDGAAAFRNILAQSRSLIAFQVETLRRAGGDAATEAVMMRNSRAVLALIQHSPSAVQQSILLQEAAACLGVPMDVLQRDLRALPPSASRHETPPGKAAAAADGGEPPPRELALAEHLAAEPELAALAQKYLPLECLQHPLCRRIVELSIQAAAHGCPLAGLLSHAAAEDDELMRFAARVLAAPPKITSEFATNEESVQTLILGLRTAAVQRRRRELQGLLMKMPGLPAAGRGVERQALEEEYAELGYDIARLKKWETALEIM